MTTYQKTAGPAQRAKQALRRVLTYKPVNRIALAAANLLPRGGWQKRLPVARPSAVFETSGAAADVIMSHPERCQIAQELYWHDGKLETAQDRHALDAALILAREARTFLDIGAYTGLFALAAARVNPEIVAHAYEIVGENFIILWENVLHNDLAGRVNPHLVAIGGIEGKMAIPFGVNAGSLASSVSLDWSFAEGGIGVPIRRLDDLHLNSEGPIAVKIDVEGFEMEIFDGAQAFLARHKPDMICEVLRRAKRVDEMMKMLHAHGYRWLHITEEGFARRETIIADKLRRDWLLTTRTDGDLKRLGLLIID